MNINSLIEVLNNIKKFELYQTWTGATMRKCDTGEYISVEELAQLLGLEERFDLKNNKSYFVVKGSPYV